MAKRDRREEARAARAAGMSRRKFVSTVAATGAAFAIVPRHVLGRGFTPPSDLLNIAVCGVGGMGRSNMIAVASQNVVAMCDVDWGYAGKAVDRLQAEVTSLQERLANPPPPRPDQPPMTAAEREKAAAQAANQLENMKRRRRSATRTIARCSRSRRTSRR